MPDTQDHDLLGLLAQRAADRLREDDQAQAYLKAQGVADETVWARYRLGATGRELLAQFSDAERERLTALGLHRPQGSSYVQNPGILVPTCDPAEPERIAGFVKQAFAQNKHAVAGKAVGVACAADIGEHARIIICDNPLLTLRLAVLGAKNVVLAEVPEVLDPYADWLKEHEVIVASYKRAVLTARAKHLKTLSVKAQPVFVTTEWHRLNDEAVALLGIQRPDVPKSKHRKAPKEEAAAEEVLGPEVEPPKVQDTTRPLYGAVETGETAEAEGQAEPVEAPCSTPFDYPEKPSLLDHDARMMRATFSAGDARYEVETAFDVGSKLEVSIERDGQKARDRFDLSKEAQRKRFATSAALRTGVPYEAVEAHLIVLLDEVRSIQAAALDPSRADAKPAASTMSETERAEAMAILREANVLDVIGTLLEALGWVGEERLKKLLFLAALSRKLPSPLHAALRSGSASGKTFAMDTLCASVPPEDVVRVSALTQAALYHQGDGLKNKLLALAESDVLDREVVVQLRVLLSEGSLRQAGTTRDAASGHVVADFREAKGPVAFITGTADDLDAEVLDRCFDLAMDESEAQTERIFQAQRKSAADPHAQEGRAKALAALRNLQRLVEPMPVLIPYAERIEYPAGSLRQRREHLRFLRLIEASALLHQHQRLKDGGVLVADVADFETALELAADSIRHAADELSRPAATLLDVLREKALVSFSLNDLKTHLPDWTRGRLYGALEELTRLDVLTSERGRGKVRRYALAAGGGWARPELRVRLLPDGELSELSEGPRNKFTPSAATG